MLENKRSKKSARALVWNSDYITMRLRRVLAQETGIKRPMSVQGWCDRLFRQHHREQDELRSENEKLREEIQHLRAVLDRVSEIAHHAMLEE